MTVQPVYIYGEQRTEIVDIRASEQYEIAAMNRIRDALLKREETKAEIREIKFVDKADIPANEAITAAWKRVHALTQLGTQYEWIARYAADNPGLEIGIEYSPDTGYATRILTQYGRLAETAGVSRYRLDADASDPDVAAVLGNLSFPIAAISEVEMKQKIEEWGYEDIMRMIWFCHTPIHGKPCGLCRPCNEKIDSNMSQLLPKSALRRNATDRRYGNCAPYKLYKRVMYKFVWK